ncbi:hypothetical protein M427DRAFT_53881 [Gonapodya prolifera JEL478]|uniref:Hemerythrin-like domain-containing protein n=1 Tax=Gonapodya prolifera (strain JEL478) TaxID=1344416 RepID=A0A139AP43_GONPJ|nr:hypothetical protein M427DRAFT_53881 [Gonapodya prolifera JEL478]|eukprot:KXS18506.1 hypothetical protein M427DRAFT_53881 [Gonapodya prolifera JEL478]
MASHNTQSTRKLNVWEEQNYGLHGIHRVIRSSTQIVIETSPKMVGHSHLNHWLKYVETYIRLIGEHHRHEDEIFFPAFTSKGIDMSSYEEDHVDLHKILEAFTSDMKSLAKGNLSYDASFARRVEDYATRIKEFLFPHLAREEELATMEVWMRFSESEIADIKKKLTAMLQSEDPFTSLPFTLYHLTPEAREIMVYESMPWLVRRVLVPFLFVARHSGAWKFASEYRDGSV